MTSTIEQIQKIQKIISTCSNPKQKKTYQDLLVKLKQKLKSETPQEPEKKESSASPAQSKDGKELNPSTSQESQTKTEEKTKENSHKAEGKKESKKDEQKESKKDEKKESQDESKDEEEKESEKKPKAFFQAVGILRGEVTVTSEKSTIKIENKEYRLYYIPGRRKKAYDAIKKEIESTGNKILRVIVYPKILHLPRREQNHVVAFQLVGFISSRSQPTALNKKLRDGEFLLSGLWQFIPVCRTPCISVFRNFNKDRLSWIKKAEPARKVKFMKASHIPLLWKDSPVKPFRFNPKADKEKQGQPKFVQIKAKFIPSRDVFGFVAELAEVRDKPPGFLKASKKLKAEAVAAVKEQKEGTSGQSEAPKEQKKNQSEQLEVSNKKVANFEETASKDVESSAEVLTSDNT